MKALVKYQTLEMLADSIGEFKEKFYAHAMLSIMAFKVAVGRCIESAPNIQKNYGESFIPKLSKETGISESQLKDCREIYRVEELTPAKEPKFLKEFPTKYSSVEDYMVKRLGRTKRPRAGELTEPCNGLCPHCCKKT